MGEQRTSIVWKVLVVATALIVAATVPTPSQFDGSVAAAPSSCLVIDASGHAAARTPCPSHLPSVDCIGYIATGPGLLDFVIGTCFSFTAFDQEAGATGRRLNQRTLRFCLPGQPGREYQIAALPGSTSTPPKPGFDMTEHPLCEPPRPRATDFIVRTGQANAVIVAQITTDNYETGVGFTAAYGCADGYPGTSSLNNTGSPVASNLVLVKTNASGDFCVRSQRPTDLIVDVAGTVTGATIGTPRRAFDSRGSGCFVSFDGAGARFDTCRDPGTPPTATTFQVHVGPADANVVLQVTTDNYVGGTGFTSVHHCGDAAPGTSSLNNRADPVASNTVIARTDAAGNVCVRSQHPTDLVVDVAGTLGDADLSGAARVFDSRATHTSTDFGVQVNRPDAVVIAQLTTDNYTGGTGFTAAFDCAGGYRGTSSLNNTNNPIASNLVIVPTGADGRICVRAQFPTDLVVDVVGTIAGATITTPVRVLDTRP